MFHFTLLTFIHREEFTRKHELSWRFTKSSHVRESWRVIKDVSGVTRPAQRMCTKVGLFF